MRYFSGIFCTFLIALSLVSAKDIKLEKKGENSIIYNSEVYTIGDIPIHNDPNESSDSDGDGVGDASELIACILTADCDGDGVGDNSERAGCLQSPLCGKSRSDLDRDGLHDSLEYSIHGKCVNNPDCDGDGVPDGSETIACILMADCDGDGVNDKYETSTACIQDPTCMPAGLSKQERELGQLIDLIDG